MRLTIRWNENKDIVPILRRNLCSLVGLILFVGLFSAAPASAQAPQENSGVQVGQSYRNDISAALRDMPNRQVQGQDEHKTNKHRNLPGNHVDEPGPVLQDKSPLSLLRPNIPGPILNFDGIACGGCGALPRTNGEAGATQYVQVAAGNYEVFDKFTGISILGPNNISSVWNGFGGACQNSGLGNVIVLYDQLAGRWLISQLAGSAGITDECVAISTTSDATGTWSRYGFHLGSNIFNPPRLSVWPDGYYMSVNVFNSSGTTFLGPQPFAFDRTRMLAGLSATFITPGTTGPTEDSYLPADLDGSTMPPAGAPNSFVEFPSTGTYRVFHFHADFTTPTNSTFTLFASPPAAAFTPLCPGTRNCVPQLGTTVMLDGVADRLMFRLAYRNLGTASVPNESIVGNHSVSSGGVAGVRWFELKDVTSGPVAVAQENTYQPDTIWRWLGSAAMDHAGNLAIGFSASGAIHPQIRYAGRLATDPPNTLAQGEAHLFDGTASQTGGNGWGDISDMTIDPVDDCTFWYTNEYYGAGGTFNWRTRIGNFKFAECTSLATPTPTPSPATPTPTPNQCTYVFLDEDFDGVTAPALPQGWLSSVTSGPGDCTPAGTCPLGTDWTTSTITPYSPLNCAFHDAPSCVTDSSLYSPSFHNGVGGDMLLFEHNYDLESDRDGAVLEISINGGPFTDFVAAGGSFMGGSGYNGTISTLFQSPIAGRPAWTGDSGGYRFGIAMMPPGSGGNVVLRFRVATDCSGAGTGWRLDDIRVVFFVPCPTPTPSATSTPAPTPTATPTTTPSPTPAAQALNLSTRMRVQAGDNVGIGGFIVTGSAFKRVILRGIGPLEVGIPDPLADPVLELHGPAGFATIINDNWRDTQEAEIIATGLAPTYDFESAIVATLAPGNYTAILRGMGMTSGVGLVELYDLDQGAASKLANLSTRAFVSTSANVVIAGFILGGNSGDDNVVLRGIGPSLTGAGVPNALADPTLELHDSNGAPLIANNDWQDDPAQAAIIAAAGLAPTDPLESGIAATLSPGLYTAILAGRNNGTGVGLVEVYDLGTPPP